MSDQLPKELRDLAEPPSFSWIPANVGIGTEENDYVARPNDLTWAELNMLDDDMRLPALMVLNFPAPSKERLGRPPPSPRSAACSSAGSLELSLRELGQKIEHLSICMNVNHKIPRLAVNVTLRSCHKKSLTCTCKYHRIEERQETIDQRLQEMGCAAILLQRRLLDVPNELSVRFAHIQTSGSDTGDRTRTEQQSNVYHEIVEVVKTVEERLAKVHDAIRRDNERELARETKRIEAEKAQELEATIAEEEVYRQWESVAKAKKRAEMRVQAKAPPPPSTDSSEDDDPLAFKRK